MLRAEVRSWEGAALKIKRKGAAFLRGSVVSEGEAARGLGLLFSSFRGTVPGVGPEPAGCVRSVPGWAPELPGVLSPSSSGQVSKTWLYEGVCRRRQESSPEKRRGFSQVRNPLPKPE